VCQQILVFLHCHFILHVPRVHLPRKLTHEDLLHTSNLDFFSTFSVAIFFLFFSVNETKKSCQACDYEQFYAGLILIIWSFSIYTSSNDTNDSTLFFIFLIFLLYECHKNAKEEWWRPIYN
jgi:hypothetical protein